MHHWKPKLISTPTVAVIPFCSIVIAARNEEKLIGRCLQSIVSQSYPSEHYEVIVVNDCSEDLTTERVLRFPNVTVLYTSKEAQGKKHALTTGIAAARGEIIVTTDADCVAQPGWLNAIATTFDDNTQMVTGPVLLADTKSPFERFQALDIAGLALITASGIQSGLHHLANGANMAFRKTAFQTVGGFSGNTDFASGDDVFLVQHIARKYPGSIKYTWHPDSVVLTEPCTSVHAFIQQRLRWATKNKSLQQRSIYWIWVFIWLTFALNLVTGIIAVFHSFTFSAIALILVAMIGASEYAFLRRVAKYYKKQELLRGFVISFLMHYAYILGIGLAGTLTKNYHWKDRKVS